MSYFPKGGSGIPATTVDAKGDLIAGTAADTVARFAVGADGTHLIADSTAASGLTWDASDEPMGILTASDVSISINTTTRVVTVQPTTTSYVYYYKGTKVTVSTSKTVTLDNTTGTWFVYYDDATATLRKSLTAWNLGTTVPVVAIYWEASKADAVLWDERHGIVMDWATHLRMHTVDGTQVVSGFGTSGVNIAPSSPTNADNGLIVATGVIADEDLRTTVAAITASTYRIWWRTGASGDWTWSNSTLPYLTGATYVQYNSGGTWALSEGGNGNYINYWVVATPALTANQGIILIAGQTLHATLSAAQQESISALLTGTLPFTEMAALYRVTYRLASSYTGVTGRCRIESLTRITGSSVNVAVSGVGAHSALSGLTDSNAHPASAVSTDTTNFNGALTVNETTVQSALDKIDDHTHTGLTSLGTVTTGTWNANVIAGQYGGTGVANTGKTITLGGNLTTSGAYACTFTLSNTTSVTLPTSGTLATTGNLSQFASTTSSQLAGVISDETGTDKLVFNTSPTFVTSVVTSSASFDVFNTTATTLNIGGAATTLSIGGTPTGTATFNFATNATATGNYKIVNIGTGGASGSINYIKIGSASPGAYGYIKLQNQYVAVGAGDGSSAPEAAAIRGPNGDGLNITGGSLYIQAGNGTGTGGSGYLAFQTAPADASGTLGNTYMDRLVINNSGVSVFYTDLTIALSELRISGDNPVLLATGSGTLSLFNTNMLTVDAFGAATSVTIGGTSTASSTFNIATNGTTTGNTKTVNLGTGSAASSTTNVNIGSTAGGTTRINSATVVGGTGQTTQTLFNTIATTVNFAGAATTLAIGAATGTATINNATVTLANAATLNMNGANPTVASTATGTLTLFNTNLLTVNAFGAATSLTIGGTSTASSTFNIATNGTTTGNTKTVNIGTAGAAGSTTNVNIGSAVTGTGYIRLQNSTIAIGSGDNSATPVAATVRGAYAAGTDKAGVNLTIQPGNGTGTGGSGSLVFQTAPVAASSSTANTLTNRLTIDKTGLATFANDVTVNGTTTLASTTSIGNVTSTEIGYLDGVTSAIQTQINSTKQNRLLNSGFSIAQRGTSFTSSTTPANNDATCLLDRWHLLSDGNNVVNVAQSTDSPNAFGFSASMTVVTGNKKFGMMQILESRECILLIGSTATLSFYAKTTGSTLNNVKAAVLSWSSTENAPTVDIISAWNVSGTTPTMVANWTIENTPANLSVTNSWVRYTIPNIAIDTANTKNIAVFIWSDDTTTSANDVLYISNVKLEDGPVASTYDMMNRWQEVMGCYRFYYRINAADGGAYTNFAQGRQDTATRAYLMIPLPTRMIKTPTLETSATSTFLFNDGSVTGPASPSGIGVDMTNIHTPSIYVDSSSRLAGNAVTLYANNNSTAYLAWNAEF